MFLVINAERQQFPHPQLLTPDDDHKYIILHSENGGRSARLGNYRLLVDSLTLSVENGHV
jgi:hypothetical protein